MKCPKWCKNAVPTLRGWADPKTGELFVSKRFTQEQIDDYNGDEVVEFKTSEVVEVVEVVEPEVELLIEAPANNKTLEDMTKAELKALAEQLGVKVSKSASKKILIEKLS
jgi:NAD-dependent DNA ligase